MKELSENTLRDRVRVAIYLAAPHDQSGNPRRGWLVVNGLGDVVEFIDEGYAGGAELQKKFGISAGLDRCTGRIEISASTYNILMRLYAQ